MRTLLRLCFLVVALIVAPIARAQDGYPNRAITLVVPVPPGGASDFIARTVGQKLAEALGQPVVISNQGGASGTIASNNVAKAAPDGYTLLMSSITTHGIGPLVNTNAPYNSLRDFTSIVFLADLPLIMTINAGHAMKSVAEVIAYGKANPGKLSFASSGNGGAPHLSGELFKIVAGIDMLHVPYRGSGPAVVDLAGGRVDIMFDAAPSLLAMIQAEKIARWRRQAAPACSSSRRCRPSSSSASAVLMSHSGSGSRPGRSAGCSGAAAQHRDRQSASIARHQGCAGTPGRSADGWSAGAVRRVGPR